MGLSGSPATYARLKDIMFGPILVPHTEPPLVADLLSQDIKYSDTSFQYFFDDDYGSTHNFERSISHAWLGSK